MRTIALTKIWNRNKVYYRRYSVVLIIKWISIWQLVPVLFRVSRSPGYLILFYSIPFYSFPLYLILYILFHSIWFHSILFYSILFYSIWFNPFHSVWSCSVLFYSIWFHSIISCSSFKRFTVVWNKSFHNIVLGYSNNSINKNYSQYLIMFYY